MRPRVGGRFPPVRIAATVRSAVSSVAMVNSDRKRIVARAAGGEWDDGE
jgi:hypothetical protein